MRGSFYCLPFRFLLALKISLQADPFDEFLEGQGRGREGADEDQQGNAAVCGSMYRSTRGVGDGDARDDSEFDPEVASEPSSIRPGQDAVLLSAGP